MDDAGGARDEGEHLAEEAWQRAGWWSARPDNPRTYPIRSAGAVRSAVDLSGIQRAELEASMRATGQADAIAVPPLEAVRSSSRGWCTSITWAEGPITVLEPADVIVLFALPQGVDAPATVTRALWDVVARICGARCWQVIAGIEPERLITRRWPDADEWAAIDALSLPAAPPEA